jgi:hypothetical protein
MGPAVWALPTCLTKSETSQKESEKPAQIRRTDFALLLLLPLIQSISHVQFNDAMGHLLHSFILVPY